MTNSKDSAFYHIPSPSESSATTANFSSTIRHQGRALIRGKIRRVWRPRYLELLDSGILRYYEYPDEVERQRTLKEQALHVFASRIIDVTTLRDLHVGLPRGSYGFLFRGQRAAPSFTVDGAGGTSALGAAATNHHHHSLLLEGCVPPAPEEIREYFCAVDTLEDAQTWVIALQWAVSQNTDYHHRRGSSGQWDFPDIASPTSRTHSIPHDESKDSVVLVGGDEETETASSSNDKSISSPNSSNKGRIVVTQVAGARVIKLYNPRLQWEIAYEIALLLLPRNAVATRTVQEYSIVRTSQQLQQLVEALMHELQDHKIVLSVLDDWQRQLEGLPRLFQLFQDSSPRNAALALQKSYHLVDQCLRALAMDVAMVNSTALKAFLVLLDDVPVVETIQLWRAPSPQALVARKTTLLQKGQSQDDFVKRWLQQKRASTKTPMLPLPNWGWKMASRLHQRPWWLVGGTGVALATLIPCWKWFALAASRTLTIRSDLLLLSWGVAFCFGHHRGAQPKLVMGLGRKTSHRKRRKPKPIADSGTAISSIATPTTPTTTYTVSVGDDCDDEEEDDILLDQDSSSSLDAEEYDDATISALQSKKSVLSSPLPQYPDNQGESCWSVPPCDIFRVRSKSYLQDRIKIPSGPCPFTCRGVDLWLTANPERHIARHPSVLGGKLAGGSDYFLVNFLLPFGNFVSYFSIPPLSDFPSPQLAKVWTRFLQGDQQYRDARLKLLPIVVEGPWIVKAAVGNGTSPALLGKVIPLQYFMNAEKGLYEVDVIITASSIAKGILSVVKGHTKALTIAFAFIIEAAELEELPETALCAFQIHSLHLEDCPQLPECNLDEPQRAA